MRVCDYETSTLDVYLPHYYQDHKNCMKEAQILEDVRQGSLYGMVEVDIEVLEPLWEHFSDMSPLCLSVLSPLIGKKMEEILAAHGFTEIVFGPWFALTKIYQVIEFSLQSCSGISEKLSQARYKIKPK